MLEEFVDPEVADILKTLEFDEPCFAYYYNKKLNFHVDSHRNVIEKMQIFEHLDRIVSAPLWQQVDYWLRVNFMIHISLDYGGKEGFYNVCVDGDYVYEENGVILKRFDYFEARRTAVIKALEKVKNGDTKFKNLLRKYHLNSKVKSIELP
jgi:hypothetical protein